MGLTAESESVNGMVEGGDDVLLLRHPVRAKDLQKGPLELGISMVLLSRSKQGCAGPSTFSQSRHGRRETNFHIGPEYQACAWSTGSKPSEFSASLDEDSAIALD